MKFRKKPVVIDAITFAEFIQYGKDHGGNIVNGMPYSFEYKGHPVTHENDERYLIPTLEGTHNFTPDDMLITGVQGEIYPCKKDIFEATYDVIADNLVTELQPHQQRVVDEKEALGEKIVALTKFICTGDVFTSLDYEDKELLLFQLETMHTYSRILQDRIMFFGEAA